MCYHVVFLTSSVLLFCCLPAVFILLLSLCGVSLCCCVACSAVFCYCLHTVHYYVFEVCYSDVVSHAVCYCVVVSHAVCYCDVLSHAVCYCVVVSSLLYAWHTKPSLLLVTKY